MSSNPFDAVITQAEQLIAEREAANQLREEQARAKIKERQHRDQMNKIRQFGRGFLEAIATRVAKRTMSPSYIRQLQAYAEGLLSIQDKELPQIDQRDADHILRRFAYGLSLPHNRGVVPDDFLYGQRLLKLRPDVQTSQPATQPERIVYSPDPRPAYTSVSTGSPDSRSSNVVELRPATTPKKKGGRGAYRRKKAAGTAKTG